MSTVHIHVGQCGNQLGREFWSKACSAVESNPSLKRAFLTPGGPGRDEGGHMRAVFVDSEKKVLQKLVQHGRSKKRNCSVGYGNIISSAKGCGSNWSSGHNQMAEESIVNPWPTNVYTYTHELDYGAESSVLKTSMEVIRREVEACDCFSGFILWHSLAGGTGSGFGSRLCAELRDRYQVAYQMNVSVAPHASGESPMQAYNEILCLAGLQQDSDAIVIFENDEILQKALSRRTTTSVSIEEMNAYIADCMLNILAPVSSLTPPNGVTVGIEPWELVRSASPMSPLKLLQCRTVTENHQISRPTSAKVESWNVLCNKLCQQTRSKSLETKSTSSNEDSALAAVCVCRNVAKPSSRRPGSELDIAKMATKIKTAYNCVKWNPFPVDVWTDDMKALKSGTKQNPKSITVCSNLASLATIHCASVLNSALIKYKSRAYLHWYKKYGTEECDFEKAFEVVQSIVSDYQQASRP